MTDTHFIGNVADRDGGGIYALDNVTLSRGQFTGNTTSLNGGRLYAASTLNLARSSFVKNAAQHGGGLYHASGNGDVINSLFARNTATVSGTAVYLGSTGTVQLKFITIGSSILGNGAAIEVAQGSVNVLDTTIANQLIGLRHDEGTVIQDYNLFFSNSVDTFGPVTGGSHNATGDPKFVNVAQDNYHVNTGSAAIDSGISSASAAFKRCAKSGKSSTHSGSFR